MSNQIKSYKPNKHTQEDMTNEQAASFPQQTIDSYLEDKKLLYDMILKYLDESDEESEDRIDEICFHKLTEIVSDQLNNNDGEEMRHFLQTIKSISDNNHRGRNFINKIYRILQHYQSKIKRTLSNFEIFQIFESNKILLLYLIQNDFVTITETIYNKMMSKFELNGNRYCYFFYPEIEKFIGEEKVTHIKNELLSKDPKIFEDFDEKRKEGENDLYMCSLIRHDLVEEFIVFINRNNYSLSNKIPPSIFETNPFLVNKKEIALIEYSAFYGSIQIFQYLMMNNVELTPDLWLYTIHSQNPVLIHLLESNNVSLEKPKKKKDDHHHHRRRRNRSQRSDDDSKSDAAFQILFESIKCHHNDIAEYVENTLLPQNEDETLIKKKIVSVCLKYHNYGLISTDLILNYGFFYSCFYHYNELVNLSLEKNEDTIKQYIQENI